MAEFGDLRDVFGERGRRPDTPQFWRISQLLLDYTGAIEAAPTMDAKEEAFSRQIARVTDDPQSVHYAGINRAMKACNIDTYGELRAFAADPQRFQILARMATLFAEGFIVGGRYAKGD